MSADFSGYGGWRHSEVSGDPGKGLAGLKLLLKLYTLIQRHLFVRRSDTSFLTGIQHGYFTTFRYKWFAVDRLFLSVAWGRSRGKGVPSFPLPRMASPFLPFRNGSLSCLQN